MFMVSPVADRPCGDRMMLRLPAVKIENLKKLCVLPRTLDRQALQTP
jgi:hypothetical protein